MQWILMTLTMWQFPLVAQWGWHFVLSKMPLHLKCHVDIHILLRMNCNNFADSLILNIPPSSGQHFILFNAFWFMTKYLQNWSPGQPHHSVGCHVRVVSWLNSPGPFSYKSWPMCLAFIADVADLNSPLFTSLNLKLVYFHFDKFNKVQIWLITRQQLNV